MGINGWLWISIIILIILSAGLFIGSFFISKKNNSTAGHKNLYPFVGIIGQGENLKTKNGSNQISCPVGKNVRILGAYFQVYDPYVECNASGATTQFQKMCTDAGLSGQCPSNKGCSSADVGSACQCANTDSTKGYRNCTCYNDSSGSNKNNCITRDASAYLANVCDGKNNCSISLDTNSISEIVDTFGPLPCDLLPTDENYLNLPIAFGNPGVNANGGGGWNPGSNPVTQTTNQGYYVHGLFSCE